MKPARMRDAYVKLTPWYFVKESKSSRMTEKLRALEEDRLAEGAEVSPEE